MMFELSGHYRKGLPPSLPRVHVLKGHRVIDGHHAVRIHAYSCVFSQVRVGRNDIIMTYLPS